MKIINILKIKGVATLLFIAIICPLFSINSYAMVEKDFTAFLQELEHSKPLISDSPNEIKQKSTSLNNLIKTTVPQLDEKLQQIYLNEIQFYINECKFICSYNAKNWLETETHLSDRMHMLLDGSISLSTCSASLNCCKIMNMLDNLGLSRDYVVETEEYLTLKNIIETAEKKSAYRIIKIEIQEHWPVVYNMIYGISDNIIDEPKEHNVQEEHQNVFYVNPNEISYADINVIYTEQETSDETSNSLHETSQCKSLDSIVLNNNKESNQENSPNYLLEPSDNNTETHITDNTNNISQEPHQNSSSDFDQFEISCNEHNGQIAAKGSNNSEVINPLFESIIFNMPDIQLPPIDPAELEPSDPDIQLAPIDSTELDTPDVQIDSILFDVLYMQLLQPNICMESFMNYNISGVTNENQDTDCPICNEKIGGNATSKLKVCQCGTLYHKSCLKKWFKTNVICPICKKRYL